MNRRERRKAAALGKRATRKRAAEPLTRQGALFAIRDALSPELIAELETYPEPEKMRETLDGVADLVVGGYCTVAEAVAAIAYTNELADATVSGDISLDQGDALVTLAALRQRGDLDAD